MADVYAKQQQGVADGTAIPAERSDGREVGAGTITTLASKPTDTALNSGDKLYLGKRPSGCKLVSVEVVSGTSFGSATVAIGNADTADKYVAATTMTVTNVPTKLGPKASEVAAEAEDGEEPLWATIAAANIGAAVDATFILTFCGID